MARVPDRTSLPVLLIYNVDRAWTPEEQRESIHEAEELEAGMAEVGHPVTSVKVEHADLKSILTPYTPDEHIVFNWCEELPGVPRSYADVAQTLEDLQFAYTGSTPDVLTFSMDKRLVKETLDQRHVPTPKWRIYEPGSSNGWNCFPAIVKPAEEHCSFGVEPEAVVSNPEELHHRVEYIFDTFHQPALVEDFIDGREFRVALWGNGVIEMLPVGEMDFSAFGELKDRLCTFESKFDPESKHYNKIQLLMPAPLTRDQLALLKRVSVAAYRAVGCRDYARLDIRLRDGIFYVLDVNPNPDISSEASMAYAAQTSGLSYGRMGSRLVNLAARRSPYFAPEKAPASAAN